MSRGDDEGASADHVADGAEHLGPVLREARDLAAVLQVSGEAVEDDALDLLLDFGGGLLDTPVDDGGALAFEWNVG